MIDIFLTTLPIYLMIAVGYLAVRTGYIAGSHIAGLSQFALKVALIALIFSSIGLPRGETGLNASFFAAYLGTALPGKPRIVHGGGHAFTDVAETWVSLINLASVRDLERVTGATVDPLRFRGNIHIEGLAPWAENDWIDRTLRLGDVRFAVRKAIVRCAATNVNPATAERDMNIPQTLLSAFGANACGVYLEVLERGRMAPGDVLTLPD